MSTRYTTTDIFDTQRRHGSCTVLWDDDGEVIRHIIDFVRLPVKLAAAGDAAHAEPEAARGVG